MSASIVDTCELDKNAFGFAASIFPLKSSTTLSLVDVALDVLADTLTIEFPILFALFLTETDFAAAIFFGSLRRISIFEAIFLIGFRIITS